MRVEERFLNYISFTTTSSEQSDRVPSTEGQWVFAKELKREMEALKLEELFLSESCCLYGKIPASSGFEKVSPIGFIAHMDTSPDFSAVDVKAQIIPNYDGGDVLLKGSGDILKAEDFPELTSLKGRTLITTDGTTLLGADDKSGIAEIMTMAERIMTEPIPHGEVWIAFTPDEEIGCGSDHFDLSRFKAKFAYTVDGDYEGEIAYENFNAAGATVRIKGINVHPGEAKGIMKNAGLILAELVSLLPKDEIPAKTADREGFFHLTDLKGDVSEAEAAFLIRDHDKTNFTARKALMEKIVNTLNEKYGMGTVELTLKDSYYNMLEIMEAYPEVIELAKNAIRSVGLEALSRPVRGGTDGAMLSFKGLPCPNLGTGGYGFHGPFEHITVEAMELVVKILIDLIAEHAKRNC